MNGSKIFENYRALGYYTNHVPLQIFYHERLKENFIVTSVGKSYHIYNASKLGISRVSDPQDDDISCLLVSGNRIYVAVKNNIKGYERNKQDFLEFQKHERVVHLMITLGKHFISIDKGSTVIVWSIESQEPYLEMNFNNETFEISAVVHPMTYVNKVLFGSSQGTLQLWNVKSNKMLYEFSGWGHAVTVLKQAASAIHVIGIGLANGSIYIHDIQMNETVVKLTQDWGPVTGLAFRTDNAPVMVSASTQGHLAIWNLEERRLISQVRNAHDASVTGLECIEQESLMVTSSSDNNLKVWIFDQSDGGARILHRRQGHSAPVSHVRFYDDTNLVSAGQDSGMFLFSVDHDRHNKSMGKAVWNKKAEVKRIMPSFSQISCEGRRGSDWDDILAIHKANATATLWSCKRSTLTNHLAPHKKSHAISCAISPCGNFGFIGYQDGVVQCFNMQSRIARGQFQGVHNGSVRGLAVDGLTRLLVSGGADSKLVIWHIKSKKVITVLKMAASVARLRLHEDSAMVAVALDDFSINIVDLETRRIVRKFPGHEDRVMDMTFNSSGKWLITSSMDCTVCTWDLLTGSLVDKLTVDQAVTSLDLSPQGQFLAVSMIGEPGVFIWSNRTLYMHVPLKALTVEGEELGDIDDNFETAEQLANELVTLSLQPESRWANLLKLDIIKYRNRLRAPPKLAKSAPFFLPTIPGLVPAFAVTKSTDGLSTNETKINFSSSSGLDKVLIDCIESGDSTEYLSLMKTFGVATIESEIRCLEPEPAAFPDLLLAFLKVTRLALAAHKDYELVQSYLSLFLKIHNKELMEHKELLEELQEVESAAADSWRRLDTLFNKGRCLVSYQRSAIL